MARCKTCKNKLNEAQYALIKGEIYKSCPQCSTNNGEKHCFYKCPDDFGQTERRISLNNPLGLQSYCSRCRANHTGPHDGAILCSGLAEKGGYLISEIRFLPMGTTVFSTKEEVLTFLTETMPNRGYTYFFQNHKISCPSGTLMLFQYHAELLGCAVYVESSDFDQPRLLDDGNTYKGEYRFAPDSLILFDEPILAEDFKKIDSSFNGFSQAARKMAPGLLPAIFDLARRKGIQYQQSVDTAFYLPEEISVSEQTLKEGVKKQITVNAYERNSAARAQCISHYKKIHADRVVCEICGFDFGKIYWEEFKNKIHIHHIVELASIGEEYEVDPVKDLIPICPNCHMIAHSKKPAFTPEEIRNIIDKNNS